jgi:hypothetical protein
MKMSDFTSEELSKAFFFSSFANHEKSAIKAFIFLGLSVVVIMIVVTVVVTEVTEVTEVTVRRYVATALPAPHQSVMSHIVITVATPTTVTVVTTVTTVVKRVSPVVCSTQLMAEISLKKRGELSGRQLCGTWGCGNLVKKCLVLRFKPISTSH